MSYANLPTMIGTLKRTAIDAYMVSDYGGIAGQMWSVQGDRYTLGDAEVTRPRDDGSGGGDWSGDWDFLIGGGRDDFFQGTFDTIRGRIDDAVDRWTANLPVLSEIQDLVDSLTAASVRLGVSPSSTGGVTAASGALGGYFGLLSEGLDEMSGATIEAFKAKFLAQLARVVANQYAMTIPIGGAARAELELWSAVRDDVAAAVQLATDAMQAVVDGAGPNWDLLLTLVGVAVKGAGLFATGGLKKAAEVTGAGVSVLTGVPAVERVVKQPDSTCEGVLGAFEATMQTIADRVLAEEESLQTNLDDNETAMEQQGTGYDINARDADLGVDDAQAPGVEMIIITPSLVDGIVDTHLPNIAAELGTAADELWAGWGSGAFNRPPGIGLASGPSYFRLLWTLRQSVRDLAWEVENGATSLRLAIDDLNQADASSQSALDTHRDKVERGSGIAVF